MQCVKLRDHVCLVTAGFFHRLASLHSEPGLCCWSLLFLLCFEYAIKLALSKYLISFAFKEYFTGTEESVNNQGFFL